jgi:hypothetical protein
LLWKGEQCVALAGNLTPAFQLVPDTIPTELSRQLKLFKYSMLQAPFCSLTIQQLHQILKKLQTAGFRKFFYISIFHENIYI